MTEELSRRKLLRWSGKAATAGASIGVLGKEFVPQRLPDIDHQNPPRLGTSDNLLVDFKLCSLDDKMKDGESIKGNIVPICYRDVRRQFKCVLHWEDKKTRARWFAFREIDSSGREIDNVLRIMFPGRSHGMRSTKPENESAEEIFHGRESQQSKVSGNAFASELKPYLDEHKNISVHIFGHSLGTQTAMRTKLQIREQCGKCAETTVYEPLGAALGAIGLMLGKFGTCTKRDESKARDMLAQLRQGITSIRFFPETMPARLVSEVSPVHNMQFAEKVLILVPSPCMHDAVDDPHLTSKAIGTSAVTLVTAPSTISNLAAGRPTDRRNYLKILTGAALGSVAGDEIDQGRSVFHRLIEPAKILERYGDSVLMTVKVKDCPSLACDDDIIHPRAHSFASKTSLDSLRTYGVATATQFLA